MERLWAPWRAQYIQENSRSDTASNGCFLCDFLVARREDDRANLVVWRRSHSIVVLNRFPYNNGHLLVAPLVHRGTLGELSGDDLTGPLETVKQVIAILDRTIRPHAYNIGLNQGKAAGAGLPGHLHWHVVPRWDGDANFMPVLADTKVIIESLHAFYDRLVSETRQGEA